MNLSDEQLQKLWNLAVRDDACDILVPSDVRQLVGSCQRLRTTVRDAIEAMERGSTSAPVLESLKASLR
jgi:hypothetical protein